MKVETFRRTQTFVLYQIKVMRENEGILVGMHGKEEYDGLIVVLVLQIPRVEQVVSQKKTPLVDLMQTPTSYGDSDNDDE